MHERENVGVARATPDCELLVAQNSVSQMRPVFFRFRAVQPKGIPALGKKLACQILPIEIARLRIAGVIDVGVRHVPMLRGNRLEVLGRCIEQTPN